MGIIDKIGKFFRGAESTPVAQKDDSYERRILAENIVDSINKVKRINAFDSSIWNLANVTVYDLQRRTLPELQKIQDMLSNRISEIARQSQRGNYAKESLEASRWTGQRPQSMTNHDFDRFQRDDR